MDDPIAEKFAENVTAIDTNLTRLADENRRMKSLLAQAALFIACQQENSFRRKWLADAEEILHV
jgi:hypothetical protein